MTNLFAINFVENTIVASKTTLKKASNPNSKECKELMKLKKQYPTFDVVEKYIKPAHGKNTHVGVTKDFIKDYISIKDNFETLMKEYDEAYNVGKFPMARKWFHKTFPNFNMDLAKKEIEDAKLAKISNASSTTSTGLKDAIIAANKENTSSSTFENAAD